MSKVRFGRTNGLVVALLATVLACGLHGYGQQNKPPTPGKSSPAGPGPTRLYFGAESCVRCHNRDKPEENDKFPPLCRCTEYGIWKAADKHKDARKALQGNLAHKMGRLLSYPVEADGRCLSCHGVVIDKALEGKLLDRTFQLKDQLNEGVSCVVCHGPFREWYSKHGSDIQVEREEWRSLDRETKEKRFGLKDLWNPSKRTGLCVSCHVGNKDQNKFVTHEMYAAGHPPLPGIEIATFSDQMPKHWQYIKDKPSVAQGLILGKKAGSQEFEKTKLVVVSSITTLAETMRLLADEAMACKTAQGTEEQALDFAMLDCYACHHDLKTPSWRQQRGYVGKPGRPQMRPWPTALAKIVVRVVRPEEVQKLEGGLKELSRAFSAKPYGDCAAIAATAGQLAEHLTKIGDSLNGEATPKYAQWAPQVLAGLVAIQEIPDYDSARQIAWALEIILRDCGKAEEPPVKQVLGTLKENLKLELPAGQKSIEGELGESLRKLNEYQPDEFKRALKKLAEVLTKVK